MTYRKKLLVASGASLAILGLLAFLVLSSMSLQRRDFGVARSGPGEEAAAPAEDEPVPEPVAAAESGEAAAEPAGRIEIPAFAPGATGWTIAGRIVRKSADGDGASPAEGVRILFTRHPRRTRPEEAPRPRAVRTDTAGRFEIAGVPPNLWLRIEIDDPASAYRTLSFRLGAPDAEARRDLGDIALEPGTTLVVELVGPSGERVEKGRVLVGRGSSGSGGSLGELGFHESKRDAEEQGDGKYVLERAAAGENRVEVTAPGCAPAKERVELPREDPFVIELAEGRRITGLVRAPDESPIEGAEIEVSGGDLVDPSPKVATDAAGAFTIDFLGSGDYAIAAIAEGYTTERKSGIPAGTDGVEITLLREAVFAGRTLGEEDGKPIARARVTLRDGSSTFLAEAGDDGAFAVRKVPPGSYMVEADHPDFGSYRAEEARELVEGERVDGQVIRLPKGLYVRGRVIDAASGEPIADATVRFATTGNSGGRREGKSGTDGVYEVRGLSEGSYNVIAVSKRHIEPEPKPFTVAAGDTSELELKLEPGGSIAGTVIDADGKPLGGARLRLNLGIMPNFEYGSAVGRIYNIRTESGPDGKFVLEGLTPHPAYAVIATHDTHAPATVRGINVERRQAVEGVEIKLPRGATIRGRILDEKGEGIAGANVGTSPAVPDGETGFIFGMEESSGATSGADGSYAIRGVAPGMHAVRARATGRAAAARDAIEIEEGASIDGIDLTLGEGEQLLGQVVDAEGEGIDGVRIGIYSEGSSVEGRSRTDGSFELKGLRPGQLEMEASKSGYARVRLTASVPGKTLKVTLERTARITGRVQSKDRDEFPGLSVAAAPQTESNRWWDRVTYSQSARPDGTFEVEVGKGTYLIQATATGLAMGTSEPISVEAGERRDGVIVELPAGGTIEGVVFLAGSGAPVEGARVSLADPAAGTRGQVVFGRSAVTTREDGTFTLEGVSEGTLEVTVTHADYANSTATASVRAGGVSSVRIEMRAGGTIRGTVTKGGAPIVGAQVYAMGRSTGSSSGRNGMTGADGAFELKGVAAGDYTVTVRPPGRSGSTFQQDATVYEGQVTELVFAEGKGIRLFGKVMSGGAPLSGGSIYAMQMERGSAGSQGQIGPAGDYSVEIPRPGTYSLMVQVGGGSGFKTTVAIPEGAADVRHDIEFPAGSIGGIVVDAATGAGIQGAQVGAFSVSGEGASIVALYQSMQAMDQTDDGGRFSLTGIPPGVYSIRVFSSGHANGRVDGVEVAERRPAREVRIALEAGVSFRARVVDASGQPLARAMAFLRDASGGIVPSTRQRSSGADGILELTDLAPGTYKVMVTHSSHAASEQTVRVEPDGVATAEPLFRLGKGGKLDVQVTARRGAPIDGAMVEVVDEEGRNTIQDSTIMMSGKPLVTGADGRLLLDHLPPGEYRVGASKGDARARAEKITIREGETSEARLEVE